MYINTNNNSNNKYKLENISFNFFIFKKLTNII